MRRHFAMPVLLTLASSTLAGCPKAATQSPGAPGSSDPCGDFEVEVEKFWSGSIRAKVMDHGGEIEVEKRQGVVNKMDRISEDWVMMRTSVCKDHFVRALITREEYAARVRCFDDRLERQRTLATALAGDAGLGEIEGAIDELIAAPSSCDSPAQ